jgi:hypothetical protein
MKVFHVEQPYRCYCFLKTFHVEQAKGQGTQTNPHGIRTLTAIDSHPTAPTPKMDPIKGAVPRTKPTHGSDKAPSLDGNNELRESARGPAAVVRLLDSKLSMEKRAPELQHGFTVPLPT